MKATSIIKRLINTSSSRSMNNMLLKNQANFSRRNINESKLPKKEESTEFLINELKNIQKMKSINNTSSSSTSSGTKNIVNEILNQANSITNESLNHHLTQKENIIFINSKAFEEHLSSSNTNNHSIRYGQFISFNNKYLGQVIAIQEKTITVLVISSFNINKIAVSEINLSPDIKQYDNSMFDFSSLNKLNLSSKLSSKYSDKILTNAPLSTGEILIDYINPLYKGNLILMKGSANNGQEKLIENIINRFNGRVILMTFNNKLINTVRAKFSENSNVEILSVSANSLSHLDSSVFPLTKSNLIPRFSLSKIKEFKNEYCLSTDKKKEDMLVIMDNFIEFYMNTKITYTNAELYYPSMDIINEFYAETGSYSNGSITTLINFDTTKINQEFSKEIRTQLNNLESISDYMISMGEANNYLKKYNPQYLLDFSGVGVNSQVNSYFMNIELLRFKSYMRGYIDAHIKQDTLDKLKISNDPWDNFDYHDSKIILDMIKGDKKQILSLNNLPKEVIDSVSKSLVKTNFSNLTSFEYALNDYLIVKFIDYLMINDYMAYLYAKGSRLIDELVIFLNNNENLELKKLFIEMFCFASDKSKKIAYIKEYKKSTDLENEKYDLNEKIVSYEQIIDVNEKNFMEIEEKMFECFGQYIEVLKADDIFRSTMNDYFV